MNRSQVGWTAGYAVLNAAVWAVLIAMLVPILAVVLMSFQEKSFIAFPPSAFSTKWYGEFFANTKYRDAIVNSAIVGLSAAALATVVGTLAAIGTVRLGKLPGRKLITFLAIAPAVLPPIILAIGLFPISAWLSLNGTFYAIIGAHAVIGVPYPFITVSGALRGYSDRLEVASMVLGANPLQTFRWVTLPMIRPGLLSGFIFAFAASLDELVLAMFLSRPSTRTLPLQLWEQLRYQVTPEVAAAATMLVLVAVLVLLLANAIGRPGRLKKDVEDGDS